MLKTNKRDRLKLLNDLKKNEKAIIKKVKAQGDLRERLISFGITKGSEVELKHCSPNRENIELDIEGTFVALRKDEALQIEIEENSDD